MSPIDPGSYENGFVLLVTTLSERAVACRCADGTDAERWVTGWERDDVVVCARACSGHGGGIATNPRP